MADKLNSNATDGADEEQPVIDDMAIFQPSIGKINPANVPPELHLVIPYAEKWGLQDNKLQNKSLHAAPIAEIEELYAVLYSAWYGIDEFTKTHRVTGESGDYEAKVFDALRPVFSEAGSILLEQVPKRFLEIIGWPEAYPGAKLDPVKIPSELQFLIPEAEKWVLSDDVVRVTAIRVASNQELEEFVHAVNWIGKSSIRRLAIEMTDDKTRIEEGYVLLLLVELAENAEYELRKRGSYGQLSDPHPE